MIRHFVAMKFREDTEDAVKSGLMNDLAGLRDRIDGIMDFQVRRNIPVEDALVRGYRDTFWFDFRDTGVRDAYLEDAVHQEIGARLVAELEGGADGIFVFDYEA